MQTHHVGTEAVCREGSRKAGRSVEKITPGRGMDSIRKQRESPLSGASYGVEERQRKEEIEKKRGPHSWRKSPM